MIAQCEASVWCVSIVTGLITNTVWAAATWVATNLVPIGQAGMCAYSHSTCGMF